MQNIQKADSIKPSDVETRIFQENQVNTMVADALAPCISKPYADMVLIM